jgi:hypothetical protein
MEQENITISKSEYDELIKTKLRKKEYYQNVTKNNICHCDLCNVDIKQGSISNHTNSKQHKLNKMTQIIDVCIDAGILVEEEN